MRVLCLVNACAAVLYCGAATAQYKCIAPDGVLEYRATPCPGTPEAKRFDAQRAARREQVDQETARRSQADWQRRARELDQREAVRKREDAMIQAERNAAVQRDANRPKAPDPMSSAAAIQAAADREAAAKKAKADAAAAAAAAPRTMVCANMGAVSVCN